MRIQTDGIERKSGHLAEMGILGTTPLGEANSGVACKGHTNVRSSPQRPRASTGQMNPLAIAPPETTRSHALPTCLITCHRTPNIETTNIQVLAVDLLNRPAEVEARTHKLKKVVPEPNSFFMDVKCPGCFQITYVKLPARWQSHEMDVTLTNSTVFSHASTVVQCGSCATVLCQPTGGKAKLTEGEL